MTAQSRRDAMLTMWNLLNPTFSDNVSSELNRLRPAERERLVRLIRRRAARERRWRWPMVVELLTWGMVLGVGFTKGYIHWHWSVLIAGGVLLLFNHVLWIRAMHRAGDVEIAERKARLLLCPKCDYDIRATPDRCPECGMQLRTPDDRPPIAAM